MERALLGVIFDRAVYGTAIRRWGVSAICGLALGLQAHVVGAVPGFFATPGGAEATSSETQVAVVSDGAETGGQSVVTVMTDYQGPMKPFALVLPVPKDVKLADVKVLKRGALERLEELTAPRFHEFWEMEACEPGEAEQIWERSLSASSDTDFLGGAKMLEGNTAVPKVMRERLDPDFRTEGHGYELFLVESDLPGWLKSKELQIPKGVSLEAHSGVQFLVALVDPKLAELGARGEALLSPIRFSTESPLVLRETLGLAHVKGAHELLIYVLDAKARTEVANYPNVFPPTNLQVTPAVKERIGDFYVALHDQVLKKNPGAFLTEYAWETQGCGEPCPDAALKMFELLNLGVDAFEAKLPEEVRNPKAPARTEEQQKAYDALKKEEQKAKDEMDLEVARREALFKRHERYVMTRLHYRYDANSLPKDIELKRVGGVTGGISIPKGPKGELPQGQSVAGEANKFQTRFVQLHPDKTVPNCENPTKYRWGKPPRTYRGARKIWVADQLASRKRDRIKPAEVVLTAVPALGLTGAQETPVQAPPPAAPKSSCDCSTLGAASHSGGMLLVLASCLGLFALRGRRTKR